ncbi:hypothetical protein SAMN05660337_2748 [Maridesulfovibrio ferrireducens]|uniref:Uncharacterized protein n=1 Tax=Maridesulfovibrio ferrireducens TaxID=246191 RepID=A0A1G9JDF5_9BACT|nr:hypothetical protein [Maridesulfovibrio ferrireducens]SDL35468.1 hypothetical protein SAMN05660337_2748 [Maridesulfovibrio ferrireducens]
MEISFGKEILNTPIRNEHITSKQNNSGPIQTRDQNIDTISANLKSGVKAQDVNPELLLEKTVEANAQGGGINEAHDFDLARVMRLLSDPLLQEDIS